MRTHTFSIVIGNSACNANCPYCVSKMTGDLPTSRINWNRFATACQVVEHARDGLVSVLLTGKGEPTLYPDQIYDYLSRMDHRFPLVDLQTNGILLDGQRLYQWRELGLTLVCISITHDDSVQSNEIMGIRECGYDYWQAVERIHEAGLAVRLNCTMTTAGTHTPVGLERLVSRCKSHGVEQLTLREVDRPRHTENQEVSDWVDQHKPKNAAGRLRKYILDAGGMELLQLAHGASVFDFFGQNVCISNCLTTSQSPNDIRQVIFFSSGAIRFAWQYPGARIL